MISFRPFRNGDVPALVEIWRAQPPARWIAQPVSPALLDDGPLSKLLFDRQCVVVAEREGRPAGFAHLAFAPTDDGRGQDFSRASIELLLIRPGDGEREIVAGLWAEAERLLAARGAREIHAGGGPWTRPFYQGLFGGGDVHGLYQGQTLLREIAAAAGYQESGRSVVMHLDLARFRSPVTRRLQQIRRSSQCVATLEPAQPTWWEASAFSAVETLRFELLEGSKVAASLLAWAIEPLCQSWGVRAAGVVHLWTEPSRRRQGLATCLLAEAIKQLRALEIVLIEAVVPAADPPALALFRSLGFIEVDQMTAMKKMV